MSWYRIEIEGCRPALREIDELTSVTLILSTETTIRIVNGGPHAVVFAIKPHKSPGPSATIQNFYHSLVDHAVVMSSVPDRTYLAFFLLFFFVPFLSLSFLLCFTLAVASSS